MKAAPHPGAARHSVRIVEDERRGPRGRKGQGLRQLVGRLEGADAIPIAVTIDHNVDPCEPFEPRARKGPDRGVRTRSGTRPAGEEEPEH